MANKHYGNYGDIWKHLVLAELLKIERPKHYWETHAGSASYEFRPSPERDFGASYFFDKAGKSAILKSSQFYSNFQDSFINDRQVYPGSPLIAMKIKKQSAGRFIFCDIDSASLESIEKRAFELKLPGCRVATMLGDGHIIIEKQAAAIRRTGQSGVFVFIDPYCIYDESDFGHNALELFGDLAFRGQKTMLWYCYDSICLSKGLLYSFKLTQKILNEGTGRPNLWCGEIYLQSARDSGRVDPKMGIMGCGIICGNLSKASKTACRKLGGALENLYKKAKLPDGQSSCLKFKEIKLE